MGRMEEIYGRDKLISILTENGFLPGKDEDTYSRGRLEMTVFNNVETDARITGEDGMEMSVRLWRDSLTVGRRFIEELVPKFLGARHVLSCEVCDMIGRLGECRLRDGECMMHWMLRNDCAFQRDLTCNTAIVRWGDGYLTVGLNPDGSARDARLELSSRKMESLTVRGNPHTPESLLEWLGAMDDGMTRLLDGTDFTQV